MFKDINGFGIKWSLVTPITELYDSMRGFITEDLVVLEYFLRML